MADATSNHLTVVYSSVWLCLLMQLQDGMRLHGTSWGRGHAPALLPLLLGCC